jgi:hypothetical protein
MKEISRARGISLNPSVVMPLESEIVSFEGFEALYTGAFTAKHKSFFRDLKQILREILMGRQDPEIIAMLSFHHDDVEGLEEDRKRAEQGLVEMQTKDGERLYKNIRKLTLLDVPELMREIESNAAAGGEHVVDDGEVVISHSPRSGRVMVSPSVPDPENPLKLLMVRWGELREEWPVERWGQEGERDE